MLALLASIKGADLTAGSLTVLPRADTMSAILKRIGSTVTEGTYFGSGERGVQPRGKELEAQQTLLAQGVHC